MGNIWAEAGGMKEEEGRQEHETIHQWGSSMCGVCVCVCMGGGQRWEGWVDELISGALESLLEVHCRPFLPATPSLGARNYLHLQHARHCVKSPRGNVISEGETEAQSSEGHRDIEQWDQNAKGG